MSQKIFMDVTPLMLWNRPPVGIIRVQMEFANYLLQNDKDSGFFIFDYGTLAGISRDEVSQKIDELKRGHFHQPISRPKPILSRVYSVLTQEGFASLFIKICRRVCPCGFYKRLSATKYYKFFTSLHNQEVPKPLDSYKAHAQLFDSKSIVINTGLEWEYKSHDVLRALKEKSGFKLISFFHDAIPMLNTEFIRTSHFLSQFSTYFESLLFLSDKIACNSDFSKSQLLRVCEMKGFKNIPPLKTIHLGNALTNKVIKAPATKRSHGENYAIFVSTIERRKNHALLLRVWQKLLKEASFELPHLVFVGLPGPEFDEIFELCVSDRELCSFIHFYHDVTDDELAYLYKNAKFSLFPSYVEGWGLGAVESMLYGVPCIVSDSSSLGEATQGIAPSFSPYDVDAWARQVKKWCIDEQALQNARDEIQARFVSRSWDDFGREFCAFIRS